MTTVSVIVPTIHGRETLYEQTIKAYRDTTPDGYRLELISPRDYPTIGEAWNVGMGHASGQFVHLTADDVTPVGGWLTACMEAVAQGCYPAPRILRPDGSVEACGSLGAGMLLGECPDWTPCVTSPFPFFKRPEHPPVVPAVHYYADDYLAHWARGQGLRAVVRTPFTLAHHEGVVGRPRVVARAQADRQVFLNAVSGGE